MDKPLAFELGNVVASLLKKKCCDECGSGLRFSYSERMGEFLWFVYAKCPNGCFEEDEYNLFKIERKEDGSGED